MKYAQILVSLGCALAFGSPLTLIAPEARAETVRLTCTLDRLEGMAAAADTTTLKIDYDAGLATWNGQTGPITLNDERPDIVLFLGWVNSRNAAFYRDTGKFGYGIKEGQRVYARSSTCRKS